MSELKDQLKTALRAQQPKQNLTTFWQNHIQTQCQISYFHLANMLDGRVGMRSDIKAIVDSYLANQGGADG